MSDLLRLNPAGHGGLMNAEIFFHVWYPNHPPIQMVGYHLDDTKSPLKKKCGGVKVKTPL